MSEGTSLREVHVRPVDVIAGREPRLEAEHGRGGLGQHRTVDLHAHRAGGAQRVDPACTGCAGGRRPARPPRTRRRKRTTRSAPCRRGRPPWRHPAPWPRRVARGHRRGRHGSGRRRAASPLRALVDQRVVQHVGQRDVVLREGGPFPHVAGLRRVDHHLAAEVGADAAWHRLDVVGLDGGSGVVGHRGLQCGAGDACEPCGRWGRSTADPNGTGRLPAG